MADYFTQFSEMLGDLTDQERAWIKERIKEDQQAKDEDSYGWCDDDRVMEFDFEFEPEGLVEESHFWIYSDTCGSPDCVADFVQKFLARFRPEDSWTLSWANTCSKPRLDSFGGGTMVVTASEIKACDGSCVLKG
jgi:hypothetical protein